MSDPDAIVARVRRATSAAAAVFTVIAAAQAQTGRSGPEALAGTWRGTSICTDRVAAPACHDETVVYEFSPGADAGTVHWVADKVVDGKRERMGELELTYDDGERCWKAEFQSPRTHSVWRLAVDGPRLSGSARLLPGNQTIRKVDARREDRPPATPR